MGGWITENYNWHWLFFINVVPGIYIAVAVPLLVKVDIADPTLLRGADYLSILLLAVSSAARNIPSKKVLAGAGLMTRP